MMIQTYEKGTLYQVSIADFRIDPDQPRKVIDPAALEELKESIRVHGILQPLLFRDDGQGWKIIVAGERRFRAAQELGILVLPAIYVEGNHAEIALIDNLQRQDLTCIEEAEALKKLMDDAQYTQEQLAAAIGKARSTIADSLSLMNLPSAIRDACRGDRTVGKKLLLDISRKKQQRAMFTAWDAYKASHPKNSQAAPTGEKKTVGCSLAAAIDNIRERMGKADFSAFTEEELDTLANSMTMLNESFANRKDHPDMANLA
jgi:ParB family chromosome partitioning protein